MDIVMVIMAAVVVDTIVVVMIIRAIAVVEMIRERKHNVIQYLFRIYHEV